MSGVDYPTACHYVLNHVGHPGQWIPPGGFYAKLLDAAFHADPENLTLLGLGFPTVAHAVTDFRRMGPELLAERLS